MEPTIQITIGAITVAFSSWVWGVTSLFAISASSLVVANTKDATIIVQSTTSTSNSGLYDHLLPQLLEDTGVLANIVAVGTGQAIRNARNCDADVLLVHAKAAEEEFVRDGYGVARQDLMYNDFIVVGPQSDPAGVRGQSDIIKALTSIANDEFIFASRGDDSGTHKKELALWDEAKIDVSAASGRWYRETGSGMGATLNVGVGMGAYVLTDRATWISYANKSTHDILVEGDVDLFNQYGIILVSSDVCPNVNEAAGSAFVDWLLSDVGQQAIAAHQIDGQQLFFPNAVPDTVKEQQ